MPGAPKLFYEPELIVCCSCMITQLLVSENLRTVGRSRSWVNDLPSISAARVRLSVLPTGRPVAIASKRGRLRARNMSARRCSSCASASESSAALCRAMACAYSVGTVRRRATTCSVTSSTRSESVRTRAANASSKGSTTGKQQKHTVCALCVFAKRQSVYEHVGN